jgi:hypothetical protein
MDRGIITDIAGDDQAVCYSNRQAQVMMLKHRILSGPDPYKPVKGGIADLARLEGIGHQNIIPV